MKKDEGANVPRGIEALLAARKKRDEEAAEREKKERAAADEARAFSMADARLRARRWVENATPSDDTFRVMDWAEKRAGKLASMEAGHLYWSEVPITVMRVLEIEVDRSALNSIVNDFRVDVFASMVAATLSQGGKA